MFSAVAKALRLGAGIGASITHSPDFDSVPIVWGPDQSRFAILHSFPPPTVEASWREYLNRLDFPAHYDTPEFFLEPYWDRKRPFAILAYDQQKVVGVVTGLHVAGRILCGDSSRPQISIDKTSDLTASAGVLSDGLLVEADREKLISVFSWSSTPLSFLKTRGFHVRALEGDVVLDLSAGAAALFAKFSKNRRRDIRAAIRNGIEVFEEATENDLSAYWEVYSAWRRTERKKIYHNRSFASIKKVHTMRRNHRRFLARYQGKVIAAAGLRFCPGGLVEFANNCSLDAYLKLLPNDLLVWRTIEWACEQGFKRYSLGGAHPFLKKWGGDVVPIYPLPTRPELPTSLRSKR